MPPDKIKEEATINEAPELELPTAALPYAPPTRLSLEQAYQYCEDYWHWFGLQESLRKRQTEARCTEEFVL